MRFFFAPIIGLAVALTLFVIDQSLISRPVRPDNTIIAVKFTDFVRVSRDSVVNTKKRQLPNKPPPPKRPPPPEKFQADVPENAPRLPVAIDVPNIGINVGGGTGPYLGSGLGRGDGAGYVGDAEVIPVVRIQPQYPRRALLDGIEGWVEMNFTILKDGSVSDVSVVAAEPRRIFDQSAVRALARWKFRPRVIDGKPIERRASQTIEFRLDDTA